MTIYDLPASSNWSKLLRDYGLVNLFCKLLVPGMAQNDLLLEIVMLIANITSDPQVRNEISLDPSVGSVCAADSAINQLTVCIADCMARRRPFFLPARLSGCCISCGRKRGMTWSSFSS
jgi:hypothetical protein